MKIISCGQLELIQFLLRVARLVPGLCLGTLLAGSHATVDDKHPASHKGCLVRGEI